MSALRWSPPFALLAALLTVLAHLIVLWGSDLRAIVAPISSLSREPSGALHTVGLIAFGAAHLALALGLGRRAPGWMWPAGRALVALSGVGLFYVAWYFATAPSSVLVGPDANDPLGVLASLIGLAMGALLPGLGRLDRGLWRFNLVCVALWLAYVPLIALVNDAWLGGYERLVGATYVLWVAGLAIGLIILNRRAPDQKMPQEPPDQ